MKKYVLTINFMVSTYYIQKRRKDAVNLNA